MSAEYDFKVFEKKKTTEWEFLAGECRLYSADNPIIAMARVEYLNDRQYRPEQVALATRVVEFGHHAQSGRQTAPPIRGHRRHVPRVRDRVSPQRCR